GLASPLASLPGVSSQLNTSGRHFAPRRAGMPCVLSLLHSFRFIGLAFLVKCVVAPELPAAFAVPAAYGDLIAALLALVALVALRRAGFGIPLVWAFNLWATAEDESLKLKSPPLPGVASGTFIQPRPE